MKKSELQYQNDLVEKFNKTFKAGSKVKWRSHRLLSAKELITKSEAFMNHGNAVVFFKDKIGFCSIEPSFIIYPYVN